jgi:dimeric dUTPase (all-alpha-NTP-PPase superfamily)
MSELKKVLNEKILTNDNLLDIKLYLSEIYNIEIQISELLRE